jgi:WD40 repeat protein
MPKIWITLIGVLVVGTACSSGEAVTVVSDYAASPSGGSTDGLLQPVLVIGDGRATQASSATGTGGVIATTIGASVIDADATTTALPTALPLPLVDVVVASNGTAAVVSDATNSELWSLAPTPTLLAEFPGASAAAFTSDGATVVTSSPTNVSAAPVATSDSPRSLIDAPAGTDLGAVTMTPDGATVITPVSGDGADFITYSEATGAVPVDVFADPLKKIIRAELADDGQRLVFTTSTGDPFQAGLASWTPTAGVAWEIDAGPAGAGSAWATGSDGRVLLADESTLRLIGLDGAVVAEWPFDGPQSVTSVVATQTGYAVAYSNSTLLFTNLDGAPYGPAVPTGQPLIDLEPLASADGVVAVTPAGDVRSWAADGVELGNTTAFQGGAVNDVALSADDASVAFSSTSGTATVTSVANAAERTELVHPEGNVDSVAFSPDGSTLLTGVGQRLSDVSFDDTVSVWDLTTATRVTAFGGEGEDVNGCANFRNTVEYSLDGSVFAATSHDFTVSINDATSGAVLHVLPPHVSSVLDIAFSPTGDRLVTASDDGAVRVWQVDDAALLAEFVGPPGGYWSLDFVPDGNSLVVADLTGTLHRIDLMTGAELLTFAGTTTRTGRFDVSPDGAYVAGASDGNSVGIWSVETGQLLEQVEGHAGPVTSAVFASDGATLVTGSNDATVRVWQLT